MNDKDLPNSIPATSMDLTEHNLEQLKALFPNVFTEGKVDFDALKAELGEHVERQDERYQFTWAGKEQAKRIATTPSLGTLRPAPGESVNWDETENLYIEGDNLEVLKLLQKSYFSKVKMIYIDPPYNTGNDFVYKDDFKDNLANYQRLTGQRDEEGYPLTTNTDSAGRYHSNWLNMMYPRLKLARNLLRDDGVIFVHIDDNEFYNLSKICKEIFGEDNFLNIITVKTKIAGVSGSSEGKSLRGDTEFILLFAKDKNNVALNPIYKQTKLYDYVQSYIREGKSWKYTSVITHLSAKTLIKEDLVKGMRFYGYEELETQSVSSFAESKGISVEQAYNEYAHLIFRTTNAQSSVRQTVINETAGHEFPLYGCEYEPIKGRNQGKRIEVLYKASDNLSQRNMVMFLTDVVKEVDGEYFYLNRIGSLWEDIDYNNLTKEGDVEFANGKKPIRLMQRMLGMLNAGDEMVVLDFFAGSSSTAHAVIQQNIEDGANRKFIMVQIPEPTRDGSEASQAGYATIAEIGKERIRRAANKIREEHPGTETDLGFKVLKLDNSNIRKWQPDYDNLEQDLLDAVNNIVDGRSSEDLLCEVLIKYGLPLTLPVEMLSVAGHTVYNVAGGSLVACFDEGVTLDAVQAIIGLATDDMPILRIVFRDNSFADDIIKTNAIQRFKQAGIEDVLSI